MEYLTAMLIPAAVMALMALAFGILLVVFSQIFSVKKDAKAEEIEKLLAGTNCGGCGKPGCYSFAEALVKGRAELSECRPTAKDNKEKICALLADGEEKP